MRFDELSSEDQEIPQRSQVKESAMNKFIATIYFLSLAPCFAQKQVEPVKRTQEALEIVDLESLRMFKIPKLEKDANGKFYGDPQRDLTALVLIGTKILISKHQSSTGKPIEEEREWNLILPDVPAKTSITWDRETQDEFKKLIERFAKSEKLFELTKTQKVILEKMGLNFALPKDTELSKLDIQISNAKILKPTILMDSRGQRPQQYSLSTFSRLPEDTVTKVFVVTSISLSGTLISKIEGQSEPRELAFNLKISGLELSEK